MATSKKITVPVNPGGGVIDLDAVKVSVLGLQGCIDSAKLIIDMDTNVVINNVGETETIITIPSNKVLYVRPGKIFSGTGKLIINTHDLHFYKRQVFHHNFNVIFSGAREFYPEYFGATMLENYVYPGIDSLDAFIAAINSGNNPNYPGENKYFTVNLKLLGAYAIRDTIICQSKTVNFIGLSQAVGGSQIRWQEGSVVDMTTVPLIRFDGCNYAQMKDLSLQAPPVDEEDTPMFAAIQLLYNLAFSDPQRSLSFENITIGQGVGNENVAPGFWSFQNGIICGTGNPVTDATNANCDFVTFKNIKIAHCEVAIGNHYSQALDWLYHQITIINCGIGLQFNQGGNFVADSVYFDRGMTIGCIKGPLGLGDSLRFSAKVSTEHLKCQYFLYSEGPVIANFQGGLIQVKFDEQIIPTGIFYLLTGECMKNVHSMFTFSDQIFGSSGGTGKIAIDLPGTGSGSRNINFINCESVGGLWFKFHNVSVNNDKTFINIQNYNGNFNLEITNQHSAISAYDATNSCYWLLLQDALDLL